MGKFLAAFAWLLLICDFSSFADRMEERLSIEKLYEDRDKRGRISKLPVGKKRTTTRPPTVLVSSIEAMAEPDGKTLNFYVLPIGQGDAQILQCPNGDVTIIDLGSKESKDKMEFWSTNEIQSFLQGHFHRIKNIVITHNDEDHFNFFPKVFSSSSKLANLENITISCTFNDTDGTLKSWMQEYNEKNLVQTINGGSEVLWSTNKNDQWKINLCPNTSEIVAKVLSANAGHCKTTRTNEDSIVIQINFGNFSMQLNGDFEGVCHQKNMAKCIQDLQVTVYKLSHHGADVKANKPIMLDAVRPKAVFASSNPWYNSLYRHPRCSITKYFVNKLKSLCKPNETNETSDFYCGLHPITNITIDRTLQRDFACGTPKEKGSGVEPYEETETNEFAIYSTTPSKGKMNLIRLVTDGDTWGFVNKYYECCKVDRSSLCPLPFRKHDKLGPDTYQMPCEKRRHRSK